MRLSRELAKRSTGKTLYLLDEPTVGLHNADIIKLLSIFHSLVDKGNTLVIIEHNLDVIANADYIVDLGPEAGAKDRCSRHSRRSGPKQRLSYREISSSLSMIFLS